MILCRVVDGRKSGEFDKMASTNGPHRMFFCPECGTRMDMVATRAVGNEETQVELVITVQSGASETRHTCFWLYECPRCRTQQAIDSGKPLSDMAPL